MQHLCQSASSQLCLPQHSQCTSCLPLSILAVSSDPSSRMKNWPLHLSSRRVHAVPLTIFTAEHPNFDYCYPNFDYCFLFQVYSWTPLVVTTPLSIYPAVWSSCQPSCVTPSRGSIRGKCRNQEAERHRTSEWTAHSGTGFEINLSIGDF